MKLPNLDRASVSEQKVATYLLNPKHPDGAGKATFFIALGFRAEQWEMLAEALKRLAAYNEVSRSVQTEHGWKYVVEGEIETPRRSIGRDPHRVDCRSRPVVPTAGDGLSSCAGERR
jgi:hypothetical protein